MYAVVICVIYLLSWISLFGLTYICIPSTIKYMYGGKRENNENERADNSNILNEVSECWNVWKQSLYNRIRKTRGVDEHGIVQHTLTPIRRENSDHPPSPVPILFTATFLKLYIVSRNFRVLLEVFIKLCKKNLKWWTYLDY